MSVVVAGGYFVEVFLDQGGLSFRDPFRYVCFF